MDESKSKGVYIAILNQGAIRTELAHWITEITHQKKYRVFISYPSKKPIANNRNYIVKDFLAKEDYDYLIMIDSDIIPPLNLLDLVDYQKEIISPVCFAYMNDSIVPLVVEYNKDKSEGQKPFTVMPLEGTEGLVEVDAVGTGAMIIRRDVLEKIKDQPFCNRYDEEGLKTMGLDFSFCDKARKEGIKVHCHLDYTCSHWVKVDLKEMYRALTTKEEIKMLSMKDDEIKKEL